jgi:hypothetical protein
MGAPTSATLVTPRRRSSATAAAMSSTTSRLVPSAALKRSRLALVAGGPHRVFGCSRGCSAIAAVPVVCAWALLVVAASPELEAPEQAVATSAMAVRPAVIQRPRLRWLGGRISRVHGCAPRGSR